MRLVVRVGFLILLPTALFSCASKPVQNMECSIELARKFALRDARNGERLDLSFLQGCSAETRSAALEAYKESYEASKRKRAKEKSAQSVGDESLSAPSIVPIREPEQESWVCEIEANAKIFTGTGLSRDEALSLAKKTCGSYFAASSCTESNCKKSL
jgi:hypothetical protein